MLIEKNSKVLVIVSSLSKTSLASSERGIYLIKTLIKHGVNVDVLTVRDDDIETFEQKVKIYQCLDVNPVFKSKFLNRILSPFPDSAFLKIWKNKKYVLKELDGHWDVVISSTPPHSLNYIAAGIVKKTNAKWIIDLRDAWKGNRLHKYGTIIHQLASDITYKKYLNSCDLILANTEKLRGEILNHNVTTEIRAVPNGYPRDNYTNVEIKGLKYEYLYSGAHYNYKAVNVINQLLTETGINKKVAFLGDDFEVKRNCYSLGRVPAIMVPEYLHSAKVLVLYLPKEEKGSARILLKAYGYAKTGKPIIYIGPQNATYDFLIHYSNVFKVDEDEPASMFEVMKIIEAKNYKKNIKGINSDFSYEINFESKLLNKSHII